MTKQAIPRRNFLTKTFLLSAPGFLDAKTSVALGQPSAAPASGRKLRVVCVGAHPDDPESGCAGTLSRYAADGHSITIVYLTRGERGIRDTPAEAAAKIRTKEAEQACNIIGATPVFFGQVDAATELTPKALEAMKTLFVEQKPDVLFAHWPIDTHMDHQVASLLAIRAWMGMPPQAELYFFEVDTGSQSEGFLPNTYVDVSQVLEKKKTALFAHASQDAKSIWANHHEIIAKWRGREAGVQMAEAFVRLDRARAAGRLPGL